MITRRDALVGSACLAAAGASYGLTPRRRVSLLGSNRKLESIVPIAFAEWTSQDVSDLVAPKVEGSLVAKLYNESLGRVYTNSVTGFQVMALLAHGDTQTDDLQLHRPETCYPAFGFTIRSSSVFDLIIHGPVSIPSRRLVADAPERRENIVYWSRLGEYLPISRQQQQVDRMATAFQGNIADGLLSRFSVVDSDTTRAFAVLEGFIPKLVLSVAKSDRAALIGTDRAKQLVAESV